MRRGSAGSESEHADNDEMIATLGKITWIPLQYWKKVGKRHEVTSHFACCTPKGGEKRVLVMVGISTLTSRTILRLKG